ncbi:MAG: recombinase family protein [Acidobacteria bacterium]|nr:recombinase family protein [Acidobacteriota bacterium]
MSLRDNLDLSTPSGRLTFQVVGAMAGFKRALTQERMQAGLRVAKSKGKRPGRPRTAVDAAQVASLRAASASWRVISEQLGVRMACRALQTPPKNPSESAPVCA